VAEKELKMWLIVRGDLPEMTVGKLAIQSGHAFQLLGEIARKQDPEVWLRYLANSMPKISVKVPSAAGLERACREAEAVGIPALAITDEGRTCFSGPTLTVAAVGPCTRDSLPKFIARLQLLKDPEIALPEDFITHRVSWRNAIIAARDAAPLPTEDQDDRGYWEHELKAFDRAYAEAGIPCEEVEPQVPAVR
jgi:PTH2 family peptidyl-tRNA hydrolase